MFKEVMRLIEHYPSIKYLTIEFYRDKDILIDDEEKPKEFLYLLVELLIRQKEKNKTKAEKHAFIPYDLVFLKYIH